MTEFERLVREAYAAGRSSAEIHSRVDQIIEKITQETAAKIFGHTHSFTWEPGQPGYGRCACGAQAPFPVAPMVTL